MDAREIFRVLKENRDKLDSCKLHDFSLDINPGKAYGKKYMCSKCRGEVDLSEKLWYERGLKHGGYNRESS